MIEVAIVAVFVCVPGAVWLWTRAQNKFKARRERIEAWEEWRDRQEW